MYSVWLEFKCTRCGYNKSVHSVVTPQVYRGSCKAYTVGLQPKCTVWLKPNVHSGVTAKVYTLWLQPNVHRVWLQPKCTVWLDPNTLHYALSNMTGALIPRFLASRYTDTAVLSTLPEDTAGNRRLLAGQLLGHCGPSI